MNGQQKKKSLTFDVSKRLKKANLMIVALSLRQEMNGTDYIEGGYIYGLMDIVRFLRDNGIEIPELIIKNKDNETYI